LFRKSNSELNRINLLLKFIQSKVLESQLLRNCKFVLQGGEFTEHPEHLQIARFFKEYGIQTALLTNCIDPEKVLMVEPEVGSITISYDGIVHDMVRGAPNNTEKIKYFLNNRKKVVPVTLQLTLGPWNMRYAAIHSFLMMCSLYNVNARINVAQSDGFLRNGSYLSTPQQLTIISHHVKNFGSALKVDVTESLDYLNQVIEARYGNRLPCRSLSMYTTITAEGEVLLCQGLDYVQSKVGSLHDDNFDTIWHSMQKLRSAYKKCAACCLSCQLIGDLKYAKEQGKIL
jgi:MoaA/NifB/PqqE/SkfB family radical SAM enzyme